MATAQASDERLGFEAAWKLLAFGLGCLTIVGIVTLLMILKFVIFPKRQNHVPTTDA
ncbi:hypothetical protein I4U23_008997 [Adineta vaga]|nr:hypothetical protein I4U23_008997 [Adineta vaga]